MLIPQEVRKCVAFLGYQMANGNFRFAGTVFFLGRQIASTDRYFTYAVTAKHVVDGIRQKGLSHALIRFNFGDGTSRWARTAVGEWYTHPTDPTADVAVLKMWLPPDSDHLMYPITECVSEERIRRHNIGSGDEVFLTGLFAPHFGKQRNIPIVRVGNIAAMPEEPVASRIGPVDAYLIEARSIGGLSGSPVFVNLGFTRWIDGGVKHANSGPIYYLLGLMHGHWDLGASDLDAAVEDHTSAASVNMGIGIVVPIHKILETLDRDEFLTAEQQTIDELRSTGQIPTAG
jgi:hypothetical protein